MQQKFKKIHPVRNKPPLAAAAVQKAERISNGVKLIIGLGNPGKKSENTYHNVGVLFIAYLKKQRTPNTKYQILNTDCYMNESGKFVRAAMKKRGLKSKELLIVHDDSDIELGSYKFSFGRSSAGHKGVESITQILKTKDFWRLRIGIRTLGSSLLTPNDLAPQIKAGDFVLKKITSRQKKILEDTFKKIERDCSSFI